MKRPITRMMQAGKRLYFGGIALVVLLCSPAPYVFADGTDGSASSSSTSPKCSPVAPAPAGINHPTGAWAGTFTYNSCTGLWENAYYTWSPATQSATPKDPLVYSCDTTTWQWVAQEWVYSPAAGAYKQVPVATEQLPAGAQTAAGSPVTCEPAPSPAAPSALPTTTTAPDTGSSLTGTNSNILGIDNTTSASIDNQIGSVASTGDASVLGNTTGGNATSGNAQALANIINGIQSSSSLTGGNVVTFTANINGNVQGDLLIDPSQIQPAAGSASLTNTNNLTVNNQTSGQITNTIDLAANSGNVKVGYNTTGGSAASGSAEAIANVVNMLNSVISSGKSFIGTININGNLNGNILMPQKFLDSLIASNAPSSTVTLSQAQANSLGITTNTNQTIANNVTSKATTGAATVTGNTTGGNATSGAASTKVTIFNLTGSQVMGTNCLLVFVNVSGKWVGVIMNAPAGATAAALGSGISTNTVNTAAVNATTNEAITNNINVAANSGNALVTDNTTGGNATSGNADTAVNLLNLENSQIGVSGWFGVLFINVFGNWYGNFGVYTPLTVPKPHTHKPAASGGSPAPVFKFLAQPHAVQPAAAVDTPLTTVGAHLASKAGQTLGSSISVVGQRAQTAARVATINRQALIGGLIAGFGLVGLAAERWVSLRRAHRSVR